MDNTLILLPFVALSCLSTCGPIPVAEAEALCLDQARLAQKPRANVELAFGSGGRIQAAVDVEVTSDYLAGRDASTVFNACVQRRSGQVPSRSLSDMPDRRR